MTHMQTRHGGCLCGAVRYEVVGEPYVSGLCHCATCRKLTGSVFSATANWRIEQFRVTGNVSTYERRQFCPNCGSRLFFLTEASVEIFLGTLDDAPNRVAPKLEVWAVRREPWLPEIPGTNSYTRDPPVAAS